MNHYHHLTLEEREEILRYSSQGCSIGQIAKLICRSKSTVSRELKRNASSDKKYSPSRAQRQYQIRRLKCRPHKILSDPRRHAWVKDCFLNPQWSPEQIAGWLQFEQAD